MKPITITLDRLTLRDIDELTKVKYFSTSNIWIGRIFLFFNDIDFIHDQSIKSPKETIESCSPTGRITRNRARSLGIEIKPIDSLTKSSTLKRKIQKDVQKSAPKRRKTDDNHYVRGNAISDKNEKNKVKCCCTLRIWIGHIFLFFVNNFDFFINRA